MSQIYFETQSGHRRRWLQTRTALEDRPYKSPPYGKRPRQRPHWAIVERIFGACVRILKTSFIFRRGYANAANIVLNRYAICFKDLPVPFDGYRILHLTDLHLDFMAVTAPLVAACVGNLAYDVCLLSGDFRRSMAGGFGAMLVRLAPLVEALDGPDGIWATLGNHDTCRMVAPLEGMGINILANESVLFERQDAKIRLTGIDDPHYYFTRQAFAALEGGRHDFKIVLVHTPELYAAAARNGYRLYLCGHTHGGQICMPGGIPIVTHLTTGRRYYRGLWRYGKMQGFTGQGCGTIGLPLRFFTQSEVALITLHRRTY